MPFATSHLEISHCTHHPVIPKSDLYFDFCSTLNALSKEHQSNSIAEKCFDIPGILKMATVKSVEPRKA